jgi:hypothetical protein
MLHVFTASMGFKRDDQAFNCFVSLCQALRVVSDKRLHSQAFASWQYQHVHFNKFMQNLHICAFLAYSTGNYNYTILKNAINKQALPRRSQPELGELLRFGEIVTEYGPKHREHILHVKLTSVNDLITFT